MSDDGLIRNAIEHGVKYLESAQLPSGEIPIDISTAFDMTVKRERDPAVFCTALAARALSITPEAIGLRARSFDYLLREMEPGGLWRHPGSDKPIHYYAPLDVDDTAIASAALREAGRPYPDNRRLLLKQRERNGLFKTWIVRWWPHPLLTRHFFRHAAELRDVDSVINANAVFYLGACRETEVAIEHMLTVLREDREMSSTIWYGSTFTVWYFFSHALRSIAQDAREIIVPKVLASTPANALDLATAATTLLLWDHVPEITPLVEAQRPDGSWPAVGFYHMGRRRLEPEPRMPWWGSEALTTILAVEALTRYLDRRG